MKSVFKSDKLAQTGNSSSQIKAFCGTAKIGFKPRTTRNMRTKSKYFRVFGVFRGLNFSGQLFLDNPIF
jgi:hypothetical protein